MAPDVEANEKQRGRAGYVADVQAVVDAYPDYQWSIQHLLSEGSSMAAHLIGTGTQRGSFLGADPAGHQVHAPEFAFYQLRNGLIVALWSAVDELALAPNLGH